MMETQKVSYFELKGSYEEIGRQMARRLKAMSALQYMRMPPPEHISAEDLKEAMKLYEKYCPGLVEELNSFSEESGIPVEEIAYSWMTYLIPRCSGLLLPGDKTADGHTKLIRNYEFSIEDEDLTVTRTAPDGKYAHVSGNIACFGRCEGINECGLAVSMSACGFPVSNMKGMRAPKVKGLQFWAVIRTVLENCKNVEEALGMLKDMPIAYNINLLLADSRHDGALFETMDGKMAYKKLSEVKEDGYLCATNHIVIPEFQVYEPAAMRNSVIRFKNVNEFAKSKKQFTESEMKQFMLQKYPQGMSAFFYEDWFGTIKTVVLDVEELRYSICWFGLEENGWTDFKVTDPMNDYEEEKTVIKERAMPEMFEMVPINGEDI